MPRLRRLHVADAHYWISVSSRRAIFSRSRDRDLLEGYVRDAMKRTGVRVHAYAWSNRALEFLVKSEDQPIGQFVQQLAARYSRVLRETRVEDKRMFDARYRAVLFDAPKYFLELLRYLHLAPARIDHGSDTAGDSWTSHADYLRRTPSWVDTQFGLQLLHEDEEQARQRYWSLMAMAMPHAHLVQMPAMNRKDPRVLGSDRFLEEIGKLKAVRVARTIKDIAQEVCDELGVELDALTSTDSDRLAVRVRGLIAARVVRENAGTLTEIARFFCRSPSAIARAMQRHG